MKKGIIIGGIVVVLLAAGVVGALMLGGDDDTKSSTSQKGSTSTSERMDDMDMGSASNEAGNSTSEGSSESQATTSVEIKDFAYSPSSITVKVGETVTWTNQDSVKHDVASESKGAGVPNGPLLAKGESYKFTFTKAGTYEIHCSPHPYMKQTIIVTE